MIKWILRLFLIICANSPCEAQWIDQLKDRRIITYGDTTALVRGRTPRSDKLWYQYRHLTTSLRANLILSDIISPKDQWEDWTGKAKPLIDLRNQTPENYHNTHNHYQNFLSEVISYTPGANAVAIWGDSAAVVNNANAWGGFVSARSSCANDMFATYAPEGIDRQCGPDFDAQLTGLEVDVLNGGKPGVYPNKAKHGVQVVGFGNPNGQAFSVIVENFDRPREFQRGHFEAILYAQNAITSTGRMIVADFEKASMGLDFRKALFSEGAVRFRSEGVGTGLVVNEGKSGEIYGGERWPNSKENGWLSTRMGERGFRLVTYDNTRELLAADVFGGLYLSGDVYLNGALVSRGWNQVVPLWALIMSSLLSALVAIGISGLMTRRSASVRA